jgi:DNA invertase Pin-like site-specific DNA recombinase
MSNKILAYIRTSTDRQDLNNQKLEILEWARKEGVQVADFLEISISSRKKQKERRIDELTASLQEGDTLVVTELSRLGRSTVEVIIIINALVERKVRVRILKQHLDIWQNDMTSKIMVTLLSLFADLERDFISIRTKEALKAKQLQGIRLGKPKGTIQRSKFDKDRQKIEELLKLGLSVRKIADILGYNNHIGLNTYVQKRKLRGEDQPL